MFNIFLATLNPMLTLFLCIAIGFAANKTKILPANASKVMAKLETWVFFPALSFSTMARYCTVDTINTHAINVIFGVICVSVSMSMAIPLAKLFIRQKGSERGIYTYALTFANGGYVGDPVVQALFGDAVLSYYKLFYLPLSIMIYTWGIKQLVPSGEQKHGFFRQILNAPTVAMLLGIFVGLTGIGRYFPSFVTSTLDSLKSCMGPVAMLLAGFTIANYNLLGMLKKGKIYAASLLRLFVLPMVIVFVIFGIKEAVNAILGTDINNSVLFLAFFSTASALGLNTVVFPESYGGNPETGAGMALISHTLCVISIPIMYAIMVSLFGPLSI